MQKWIIKVDEAGETARGAVARSYPVFLKVTKRNTDNLNSSCKEEDYAYETKLMVCRDM